MATLYVSKSGNDSNDGLTPSTSVLTLGKIKNILATGENNVYIGIGTYIENIAWDTSGKFVRLYGDPTGAIFSSVAGVSTISVASNNSSQNVREFKNLDISISSVTSGIYFIYCNVWNVEQLDVTNVNLRTASASIRNILTTASSPSVYPVYINFTNVVIYSQNAIGTLASSSATPKYNITLDNCDFYTNINHTSKKITNVANNLQSLTIKNGTKIYPDTYFWSMRGNLDVKDSTVYITSSLPNVSPLNVYGTYNVLSISNTALKDDAGSNLVLNGVNTLFWTPSDVYATFNYFKIRKIFQLQENNRTFFDNINSNGKIHITTPMNTMLEGNSLTYNSKTVLLMKLINNIGDNYKSILVFKLNVNASTAYSLAYDYKRNTTNSVDNSFYVMKGSQVFGTDTPLASATYTGGSHTNNTWYSKTLSFTTDSSDSEYYFVVVADGNTGATNEMYITTPTL